MGKEEEAKSAGQAAVEKGASGAGGKGKRVKLSTLLNWCLGAALLLLIIFAYFYLRQRVPKPVEAVVDTGRAVLNLPPSYRRTIYGPAGSPLNRPLMAAADPERGEIYVSDSATAQIHVFSRDGRWLRKFGKPGRGPGEFDFPMGVAVRGDRVYVADRENGRVQILTREGKYLGQIPDPKKHAGISLVPLGVHAGADGHLYVTSKDNRILVFDAQDRLVREFGQGGYLPGQFSYPNAVVVDRRGRIWVADSNNARLQITSPDGRRVEREITGFTVPQGMAVDERGRVWVVDPLQHKLYAYNEEGRLLWELGERGEDDGQFNFPSGVTTLGSEIFVVDRGNSRVVVFGF